MRCQHGDTSMVILVSNVCNNLCNVSFQDNYTAHDEVSTCLIISFLNCSTTYTTHFVLYPSTLHYEVSAWWYYGEVYMATGPKPFTGTYLGSTLYSRSLRWYSIPGDSLSNLRKTENGRSSYYRIQSFEKLTFCQPGFTSPVSRYNFITHTPRQPVGVEFELFESSRFLLWTFTVLNNCNLLFAALRYGAEAVKLAFYGDMIRSGTHDSGTFFVFPKAAPLHYGARASRSM